MKTFFKYDWPLCLGVSFLLIFLIYDGSILKTGSSLELANDSEVRNKYLGQKFKLESNE